MTCFGAEDEARTRDPNLGKVVLYQLSYFRIFVFSNAVLIVWDCKGTQKIITSKLFCKNFQKSAFFIERGGFYPKNQDKLLNLSVVQTLKF